MSIKHLCIVLNDSKFEVPIFKFLSNLKLLLSSSLNLSLSDAMKFLKKCLKIVLVYVVK